MTMFGAILLVVFIIGVVQFLVGLVRITDNNDDDFLALMWAGAILGTLAVVLFAGYAIGTGGRF